MHACSNVLKPSSWSRLPTWLENDALKDGNKGICGVAYNYDGSALAVCSRQMHLGVMSTMTGKLLWQLAASDSSSYKSRVTQTSVAWTHDSSRVVMGCVDGFRVCHADTGERLHTLHTPRVYRCAVLPGDNVLVGTHLVASAAQGYIGMWSVFATDKGTMDWQHYTALRVSTRGRVSIKDKPQLLWTPDYCGMTLPMCAIKVNNRRPA